MSNKPETTGMNTDSNPPFPPKLRFPEFRDTKGWYVKSFCELFTIGNGKDYKHLEAGEVPVYGSGGYMLSVNDHLYEGESVCIGRKGTIDNPMFLSGRFWTVDTLFYSHSFKECLPRFIFAIFQQIDWRKHNEAGGVPSLSKTNIQKIKTAVPSVPEQQKITDCLSSVEELIAAQARKVDALKIHKKGLIQQLFPREGKTQPCLRFPEFENTGKWNQKSLGGLCRIRTGKKDANEGAADGAYPFFTCAEKHIYSHSYSFDTEAILIAGNANVGQTNFYNGKFEAYQRTYVLTDFRDIFVPYLYSVLNANLRSNLLAQVQTSAMSYIRLPMLEEYQILAPPSFPEQQRIADCLASLDNLIAAETQRLDAHKTHKKGLMQQLFPSPVEVEA